jgi:hypothetical protein
VTWRFTGSGDSSVLVDHACGCPKLGPWPLTCCFTAGASPA